MGDTDSAAIGRLLAAGDEDAIEAMLVAGSSLPGPRANLELLGRFASAAAAALPSLDALLFAWLAIQADDPGGAPRAEFLPVCAAAALGARWPSATPGTKSTFEESLRRAANDSRWRLREGAAIGLQRIGESDPAALLAILRDWLAAPTFLEERAVAAALAHPPLLDAETAESALELLDRIASRMVRATAVERKREEFRVLRKGMAYAPSVVVAASPVAGFAMLGRWLAAGYADLTWAVRQNLQKKRLTSAFPAQTSALVGQA
jgi:hypothetical protein